MSEDNDMPTASTKCTPKIDRMVEKSAKALASGDVFKAEHCAIEAINEALHATCWAQLGTAATVLRDARRARRAQAFDAGALVCLGDDDEVPEHPKPGCYVLSPMLVGADGRELRERAASQNTPVVVIVREPTTNAGLWPVAMIGPVTVRTQVRPPADESPTQEWMESTIDAMGVQALSGVRQDVEDAKRIDQLVDRLATIIDDAPLHDALISACADAHKNT